MLLLAANVAAGVTSDMGRREFGLRYGLGNKDLTAPDNGGRPAPAGNFRPPDDIFRRAPGFGQSGSLGETVRSSSAILRPVFGFRLN